MRTNRKTLRNKNKLKSDTTIRLKFMLNEGYQHGLITQDGMRDALAIKPSLVAKSFVHSYLSVLGGKSRARLGQSS